jgi:hypothetical protein
MSDEVDEECSCIENLLSSVNEKIGKHHRRHHEPNVSPKDVKNCRAKLNY